MTLSLSPEMFQAKLLILFYITQYTHEEQLCALAPGLTERVKKPTLALYILKVLQTCLLISLCNKGRRHIRVFSDRYHHQKEETWE